MRYAGLWCLIAVARRRTGSCSAPGSHGACARESAVDFRARHSDRVTACGLALVLRREVAVQRGLGLKGSASLPRRLHDQQFHDLSFRSPHVESRSVDDRFDDHGGLLLSPAYAGRGAIA